MHGDGHTLSVRDNRETGVTHYECSHPSCRFYGDGISLTAAARKIPVQEAVAMFRYGGALAHVLAEPLTEAEADAYTESKMAQSRIQAYLVSCQQALRRSPDKARFRMGVGQNSLRTVPQELGLLMRGDALPPPLREFNKAKYAKANHIVYPYTYNGDITHVRIQDVSSSFTTATVPIIRSDIGVFMERFEQVPEVLLVVQDPRSAAIVYGNCMAESSVRAPVICCAGFPLPDSLDAVKALVLLSCTESPLTLPQGLAILAVDGPVSGSAAQPRIRVWDTPRSVERITADDVRKRMRTSHDDGSESLELWALRKIEKLVQSGAKEEVYRALSDANIPDAVRSKLADMARTRSMCAGVAEALESVTSCSVCHRVLGNGHLLRLTSDSIRSLTRTGEEEVLANFGLSVSHKIRAYDGGEILVCAVTCQDKSIAPALVQLPESARGRPQLIQKAVSRAFAARGQAPYIAVYERRDYDWADILCKLSEQCEIHQEVKSLGLDEDGSIHFPGAVVRTGTGSICEQQQVFTLPEHTLRAYRGIPAESALSPCEPFRYLFQRCDNLYVAAFTHGLMHVAHEATSGLMPCSRGKVRAPRHLLFVETEAGVWQNVFTQLSELLSGDDHVPSLSFTDPQATAEDYRQLGTLPLLARIPVLRGDKFPRLITESPVSIVGITDSSTATLSTGDLRTTFITPACDKPEPVCVIAHQDIEELRQAFPGFLLEFAAKARMDAVYRDSAVPSQAAYEAACELLGLEPRPLMSKVARKYFPSVGMVGVNTFFDHLHRVLNTLHKKPTICIVRGEPPADGSFTARGQHIFVMDEHVIIGHTVVELINRDAGTAARFDRRILTEELKERNLLAQRPLWLQVDTNRCWIMKREDWDLYVVRPPLLLPRLVTPGNVIQLKSIA